MLKRLNSTVLILFLIVLLGGWLRFISVYPFNTIVGFDQARDLFLATEIYRDHDLKIIGPTAGNNPNLHHGILYIYYLVPPLFLSHGSVMAVVFWNLTVNLCTVIVIYFLGRDLYNRKTGILAAFLVAVSYYYIQFSGWLSNPSPTLFTVPLFFWGLWKCYLKSKKGLLITIIGLCLSIQFELFFIYLIPIGLLLWLLLKIPIPAKKDIVISFLVSLLILSTMILTEIKYNFSGVFSILDAGKYVGGVSSESSYFEFLEKYFQTFSQNIIPTKINWGVVIFGILSIFLVTQLIKKFKHKSIRDKYLFLIIYLLSPSLMLVLGYHNAPWFLIGLPGAICLSVAVSLSEIRYTAIILVFLALISLSNIASVYDSLGKGQKLLEPDSSAFYSDQLKAIDFTYQQAKGQPFLINSVTNPLYINAVWAYHYKFYGERKYGYTPSWGGGDQLYPYNTLKKSDRHERRLFLLIDNSPRIGQSYRDEAFFWAEGEGVQTRDKVFGGWTVVEFAR